MSEAEASGVTEIESAVRETAVAQPPERIDAGDIELVRWKVSQAEALQEAVAASLPELKLFMPWATDAHGVQQSREYLERSAREWDAGQSWNYAVCVDGEVAGSCGLMTRMGPDVLEIGYWISTKYAGRGYASAATRALAELGLRMPDIERVAVRHDVANPASGRVAEKAGFTKARQIETPKEAPGQTGVELVWERRRQPE